MQALAAMPSAVAAAVRVVLTDIDDTLTTDGRLPADAYAALERLEQAGILVVPITGRPAGWCDHIARMWPVRAVVGENGAFYYAYDRQARRMTAHYWTDAAARQASRARLDAIRDRVLAEVPGAAVASDQDYRKADLAIDFCEDVPPLPEADVGRIVAIFEAAGAQAKVSSIHVNGWFGDYDKLTMTQTLFQREFGADVATLLDSTLFIGDSPNDEPMFAYFPISVGVANIQSQLHRLQRRPAYVAAGHGARASSRWPNGCWPPAPDPYPGNRRGDHTENHPAIRAQGHSRRSQRRPPQHPVHRGRRAAAGRAGGRRQAADAARPGRRRRHDLGQGPPYLVSFIRVGLVQQDGATGQYELGPFALQMGLVSLQRLDPVRIAMPEIAKLQSEIGHTLGIAVLGSHGPTMIHMTEASYPVHVNMRKGTVMSMLHTATGLVFAAWLPPKVSEHYIAREEGDTAVIASLTPPRKASRANVEAQLADIRVHGMARALGNPLPGVDALSVPVFDSTGNIALALTSLGPTGLFDVAWDGSIARPLLACAQEISRKLGYRG